MNDWGKLMRVGNPVALPLTHVQADKVSFFLEPNFTSLFELAFFKDDEWVLDVIGEFEPYADETALDTRVYRFVPRDVLVAFLNRFSF